MGDALMAMYWAGIVTGATVGLGVAGLGVAVWWFWPQHDELPDDPVDEFRCTADEPACVLVEWGSDV